MTSRPLRVAVDARSMLTDSPRGEGKSLQRLYREILRIRPHWHVVFYGEGRSSVLDSPDGTRSRYFDVRGSRYDAWHHLGIPWYAFRDHADIVHCTSSTWPRFMWRSGVMTVHDVIPVLFNDGQSESQRHRFERDLKRGLARARGIIAVSENTRHDLCTVFDVDPDRIRVIHWGSDGPVYDKPELGQADGWKKEFALPGRFALVLGGGAPRKNVSGALESFGIASAQVSDLTLVVTGITDEAQRHSLCRRAAELGVESRLRVLGYVSEAELAALYHSATMFLYLSHYEGFGLPILEAMRYGTAVVASDSSSIPEVAGHAAITVDARMPEQAAQALVDLATNETHRQQLVKKGYERLKVFRWEDTARKTVELFESIS